MANNRMYLVHVPTGKFVKIATCGGIGGWGSCMDIVLDLDYFFEGTQWLDGTGTYGDAKNYKMVTENDKWTAEFDGDRMVAIRLPALDKKDAKD